MEQKQVNLANVCRGHAMASFNDHLGRALQDIREAVIAGQTAVPVYSGRHDIPSVNSSY